jgi:hypothetical protein
VCFHPIANLTPPGCAVKTFSAGHVQNGVGIVGVLSQRLYRFSGRKNQQFDLAPRGFTLHLVHHWKSAVSAGANDQAVALPRYFLPDQKWGMTEGVAELLGRWDDWPLATRRLPLGSSARGVVLLKSGNSSLAEESLAPEDSRQVSSAAQVSLACG